MWCDCARLFRAARGTFKQDAHRKCARPELEIRFADWHRPDHGLPPAFTHRVYFAAYMISES